MHVYQVCILYRSNASRSIGEPHRLSQTSPLSSREVETPAEHGTARCTRKTTSPPAQALQGGGPSAADVHLASTAPRYSVAWGLLWWLSWMSLPWEVFSVACTPGALFALTPLVSTRAPNEWGGLEVDGRSPGLVTVRVG